MRHHVWALVVGAILGWGSTAEAQLGTPNVIGQNVSPSNIFGADPSQIQFTPFDVSRSVVPASQLSAPIPNLTNSTQSSFSLSNFFRRFQLGNLFGGSNRFGNSAIPAPSAFPGANYPSAFQPVAPFIPRQ